MPNPKLYCPYAYLATDSAQPTPRFDLFVVVPVIPGYKVDFAAPVSAGGTTTIVVNIAADSSSTKHYYEHRYTNIDAQNEYIEVYRPRGTINSVNYPEFRTVWRYADADPTLQQLPGAPQFVAPNRPYICPLKSPADVWTHTPHVLLYVLGSYTPPPTDPLVPSWENSAENSDNDSNDSYFKLGTSGTEANWRVPDDVGSYYEYDDEKFYEAAILLNGAVQTTPGKPRGKVKNRMHGTQPGLLWACDSYKQPINI